MAFTRKYITTENTKWSYIEFGHGDPIILLHGMLNSADFLIEIGNYISKNHLVIIPDLPGFGFTEGLADNSFGNISKEFGYFVEAMNLNPIKLFGASIGGGIALDATSKYNIPTQKIFLQSPLWKYDCLGNAPIERFEKLFSKFPISFINSLQSRRGINLLLSIMKALDPKMSAVLKNNQMKIVEALLLTNPSKAINLYNSISGIDLENDLNKIKIPTFIIAGENDNAIQPEKSQKLSELLRYSQFHILPNSGHEMILTNPQSIADLILNN